MFINFLRHFSILKLITSQILTLRSDPTHRHTYYPGALHFCKNLNPRNYPYKSTIYVTGGQAKICARYADLVGTKKADMQIFWRNFDLFQKKYLKSGSFVTILDACIAQNSKTNKNPGYHGKKPSITTKILKSKGQKNKYA